MSLGNASGQARRARGGMPRCGLTLLSVCRQRRLSPRWRLASASGEAVLSVTALSAPGLPSRSLSLSILLRHSFGRRIRWQGQPVVAGLLPHSDGWRGEIRVGEVAHSNGDISRKAFALPINRGAACRTKIEGHRVPTLGCPRPRRGLTGKCDLISAEARLVTGDRAGASLTLQAVTHGYARRLTLDRKANPPTAAGGVSERHAAGPSLSIRSEQCARCQKQRRFDRPGAWLRVLTRQGEVCPTLPSPR